MLLSLFFIQVVDPYLFLNFLLFYVATWDLVMYLRVTAARISIVFLSFLGQIGQKDMGFSGYLRVSAVRISIVFLSVLGQIGQKDMGFREVLSNISSKDFHCVLKCPRTNRTKRHGI